MSKLTNAARGRPCLIRLPGCSGNNEQTVACHYNTVSLGAGRGYKVGDWCAAWGCLPCHQLCDGQRRDKNLTRNEIRLAHAEGVLRTIGELSRLGLIQVGE